MTGFVFKIQANMDPNHRDRIAFMRVCSGKLQRGMRAKLVRTGKPVTLSAPQFFFAQDRSLAEEAFAGDVVGIPNHGLLRIGDTLERGRGHRLPRRAELRPGNPAPGQARRRDEGQEAARGLAADGGRGRRAGVPAVRRRGGDRRRGRRAAARRAGRAARTPNTACPCRSSRAGSRSAAGCRRATRRRWRSSSRAYPSSLASDLDGAPVFMATSAFNLRYEQERWPKIAFADVKDYQ